MSLLDLAEPLRLLHVLQMGHQLHGLRQVLQVLHHAAELRLDLRLPVGYQHVHRNPVPTHHRQGHL